MDATGVGHLMLLDLAYQPYMMMNWPGLQVHVLVTRDGVFRQRLASRPVQICILQAWSVT